VKIEKAEADGRGSHGEPAEAENAIQPGGSGGAHTQARAAASPMTPARKRSACGASSRSWPMRRARRGRPNLQLNRDTPCGSRARRWPRAAIAPFVKVFRLDRYQELASEAEPRRRPDEVAVRRPNPRRAPGRRRPSPRPPRRGGSSPAGAEPAPAANAPPRRPARFFFLHVGRKSLIFRISMEKK